LKLAFHNQVKLKFYEIVPHSVTATAEKGKKYDVSEFWVLFEKKCSFSKFARFSNFFDSVEPRFLPSPKSVC